MLICDESRSLSEFFQFFHSHFLMEMWPEGFIENVMVCDALFGDSMSRSEVNKLCSVTMSYVSARRTEA